MFNLKAVKNKEMHIFRISVLMLFILTGLFTLPVTSFAEEKLVIGWVEQVNIDDARLEINAKIDTGADTTSIDAVIHRLYQVEGEDWIRFEIINKKGQSVTLDRKIVRYVEIKRRLVPPIKRPVVELGVCLGQTYHKVGVNLANRAKFNYKMLIGRDYLKGRYLVDSEVKNLSSPSCGYIRQMDKVDDDG